MNLAANYNISLDLDPDTSLNFDIKPNEDFGQALSMSFETSSTMPVNNSKPKLSKTRSEIKERLGNRKHSAVVKPMKKLVSLRKRSILTPIEEEYSNSKLDLDPLCSDIDSSDDDDLSEGFDLSIDSYNNISIRSNDLKRISIDEGSEAQLSPRTGDIEALEYSYR
jgi:hypothetical protein